MQKPTSRSVSPAIALTTTATSFPASTSRLTRAATLRMRSIPAIDVPPNFITIRAIALNFPLGLLSAGLIGSGHGEGNSNKYCSARS